MQHTVSFIRGRLCNAQVISKTGSSRARSGNIFAKLSYNISIRKTFLRYFFFFFFSKIVLHNNFRFIVETSYSFIKLDCRKHSSWQIPRCPAGIERRKLLEFPFSSTEFVTFCLCIRNEIAKRRAQDCHYILH